MLSYESILFNFGYLNNMPISINGWLTRIGIFFFIELLSEIHQLPSHEMNQTINVLACFRNQTPLTLNLSKMKKLSFLTIGFYILFTILSLGALGQNKAKVDNTKECIESQANSPDGRVSFGEVFSPKKSKAIKDFEKTVKYASNQKWYEDKDGFIVKFEDKDGIKCRTDYDMKGNWLANTRYYDEKELPKEIRRQIMMEYLDFKIHSAQEITVPEHKAYFIQLCDDKKWVHLKILDGEMSVDKVLDKAD